MASPKLSSPKPSPRKKRRRAPHGGGLSFEQEEEPESDSSKFKSLSEITNDRFADERLSTVAAAVSPRSPVLCSVPVPRSQSIAPASFGLALTRGKRHYMEDKATVMPSVDVAGVRVSIVAVYDVLFSLRHSCSLPLCSRHSRSSSTLSAHSP